MSDHPKNYAQVLQQCLELLQDERETLDTLLARYPQFAGRLKPDLEAAAWLQERRGAFDPRPGFVSASRRRLLARLGQEKRPAGWRWLERRPDRKSALSFGLALLVVIQLLINGSILVQASRTWLPGDALYPLKTLGESARLALTWDTAGQARLHIQFAGRRMMEIQSLLFEGRYDQIPGCVVAFGRQVSAVVITVNRLSRSNLPEARSLALALQRQLSSQDSLMYVLAGMAPRQVQPEFMRVLDISASGASEVQDMLMPNGLRPSGVPVAQGMIPVFW